MRKYGLMLRWRMAAWCRTRKCWAWRKSGCQYPLEKRPASKVVVVVVVRHGEVVVLRLSSIELGV